MAEQQTDRQAPEEMGAQHRQPVGCRGGVYLVRNTSRAFLPQPQGRGHVFQHLKHVIVTDAPTGDPAHRTEAEWGPREGPREGGGGSRQEKIRLTSVGVNAGSQNKQNEGFLWGRLNPLPGPQPPLHTLAPRRE